MRKGGNEIAIVVRGFYLDREILDRISRISATIPESHTLFFQYDESAGELDLAPLTGVATPTSFNKHNWSKYKRPSKYHTSYIPGNVECSFLDFFNEHPDFSFYWFIEYDVDFSGDWSALFDAFVQSQSDLLATTLVKYTEHPDWSLWKSVGAPEGTTYDLNTAIRGFYPIVRFSNLALTTLQTELAKGWYGHFEAITASVLSWAGLSIEDIGGDGDFVNPGNANRFYTNSRLKEDLSPGTFVFRPKFTGIGTEKNKLWHPVKQESLQVWDSVKQKENFLITKLRKLSRKIGGKRLA